MPSSWGSWKKVAEHIGPPVDWGQGL
jgi:hypothetical protein